MLICFFWRNNRVENFGGLLRSCMDLLENRLDAYLSKLTLKLLVEWRGERSQFDSHPLVVFRKLYLLKRRWNPGFCDFQNCHKSHLFLKEKYFIPSKRLEKFQWNSSSHLEGMKNSLSVLAIFIKFHQVFGFFDLPVL